MYQLIRTKAVLQIVLIISLSLFTSLSLAQPVQAQQVCCPQTQEGFCQQADVSQCTGTTYFPGSCESFSECQVGCCDLTGQNQGCTAATTKVACGEQGGEFLSDEECNYAQCQPGCCQIGTQFTFTSQQECLQQASAYSDITPAFTAGGTEQACSERARALDPGCCVTTEACQRQTREMCQAQSGSFFAGELCSDVYTPQCDQCEAQAKTGCSEESTNVYFFDACGNKEGIAQTCDYTQGKICGDGDQDGNFECVDVNCAQTWDNPVVEGDGGFRYNGESWCEYDANAGPTLDLPGSRHYRHYCFNGQEYVEPCSDLRDEICIEGKVNFPDESQRAQAVCKENRALDCFQQTTKETCENNQLRDCIWLTPTEESEAEFRQDTEESLREAELEEESQDQDSQSTITLQEGEPGNCIPLVPPGSAFWQEGQSADKEESKADEESQLNLFAS